MGRAKNAGKRITAWLMAMCMILSVMPPIEAKAVEPTVTKVDIVFVGENGEPSVNKDTAYTYTGSAIEPNIRVDITYSDGTTKTLNPDEYTKRYDSNINCGSSATVTIFASNNITESETFTINPIRLTTVYAVFDDDKVHYENSNAYMFYTGSALTPNMKVLGVRPSDTVTLVKDRDYTVSYVNNEAEPGNSATVNVTMANTSNYAFTGAITPCSFEIYSDIGGADITTDINASNWIYNGEKVVPASFNVYDKSTLLTKDTDYTVGNWKETVKAGKTSITIYAKSNSKYRGSKTFEYTIQPYDIKDATVTVTGGPYYYGGEGATPVDMTDHVEVKIGDKLVSSDDYTVSYIDNKPGHIGSNWLRISGKNNLTGYKDVSFEILQGLGSASIGRSSIEYDGSAVMLGDLELTVLDTAKANVKEEGYTVTFYSDASCEESTKVEEPTEVGTYYLKIEGKSPYTGTLSGDKYKFAITQQSFSDCKFTLQYTISGVTASREVSNGSELSMDYQNGVINLKISKGVDKQGNNLSFGENGDCYYGVYSDENCEKQVATAEGGGYDITKAGMYYVRVVGTGKGNYKAGTQTFGFQVLPKTVSAGSCTVTIENQIYTGSAIIPNESDITVMFTDGSQTIRLDPSDFEIVSAANNVAIQNKDNAAPDAKIPTVQIKLVGNYTLGNDVEGIEQTLTGKFSILPRNINNCKCNLISTSGNYDDTQISTTFNGQIQKPNIKIWNGETKLTEGTDYKVTYKLGAEAVTPQNVGNYTVIIEGIGTYTGSITANYEIKAKTIEGMSLVIDDVPYKNGSKIDKEDVYSRIKLTDVNTTLRSETDYTIEGFYKDAACTVPIGEDGPKEAGCVYIKLTGAGNYTGEKRGEFYIGENFAEKVESFDVSEWTYNVDSTNTAISYYSEIQEEIARRVLSQNLDLTGDKYNISYFLDRDRSQPITAENPAFSSAGTIYFRINGTNGYYGYVDGTATIAKKSLSSLKAEVIGTYTYPEGTTVTDWDGTSGGKGVKVYSYGAPGDTTTQWLKNTDNSVYTITNGTDNRDAGSHTVRLRANENSNYEGYLDVPFTIEKRQITSLQELTVTIPSQTYSYQVLRPSVTLTYKTEEGNPASLGAGDYEIALYKDPDYNIPAKDEDLTNAGTVYVKVTGKGNYTGTILSSQYGGESSTVKGSNKFIIEPLNIGTSGVIIDIEGKNYIYEKGKTMIFKVQQPFQRDSVTTQTVELVKGQDYTYPEPETTADLLVGSKTITLTGTGNYTGTRSFSFNFAGDLSKEEHATITIGDAGTTVEMPFTGNPITLDSQKIKIISKYNDHALTSGTEYSVEYKNNTEPGLATVILTGNNSKQWYGTVEKNFAIIGDLSDSAYTQITIPDQIYTGSAYGTAGQPIQGMVVKFHNRVLTEGVDYVVSAVNEGTNVSNNGATVTITAKDGSYFIGSATADFSIKYDSSRLNITLDKTSWDYNDGNEVTPTVTVSYPTGGAADPTEGVVLTEGTDYTLIYHNNKEVGTANGIQGPYVEVKPTTNGRITGASRFVPFTINKIDISQCIIEGVYDSYLYTGSMIKPNSLKVYKSDGTTVINPSNYTVTYLTNASNPTMAPAGSRETITIQGTGNYTGYLTKEIAITPRNLADSAQATCTIADQTYSARPLTPDVTITIKDENDQEQTLTAGLDYQVTGYFNNVNAKDHNASNAPYASIVGEGSCRGSVQLTFTIKKRNMEELVYGDVVDPQYVPGKTEYRPEVSVYMSAIDEDSKLTAGREYNVTYHNNTAVLAANGVAGPYMEFTPKDTNNYEGSHQISFSIEPKYISSGDIVVSLADTVNSGFDSSNRNYVYDSNKANYSPTPTVTYKDGTTTVQLAVTDYTVTYESNTGIGTGYVVITGKGNYTGVRREAFTIGSLLSAETVTITGISDQVYTGQDTTPTNLQVKFNAKNEYLVRQTEGVIGDYTVRYYLDAACENAASLSDMQNAGRIYVAITGTADPNGGGYVGTVVVFYEITRKSLTSSDIVVQGNDDVDYTGSAVYPANLQLIDSTTGRVIDPMYYTVTYENNVDIGTASATITALDTGNYKDSITVYYRITKHNINNVVAEAIPDQRYTGGYIIPNLTLYDNGKRLVKGVDYEVVNGNNLRAGQSWVIIKGLGNYDQTKKVYFNIVASLETAIIDDIPDQLYTGNPVTPVERVACGGNTLVRGVDYTVSYANNTGVGDASITIRPLTQYYTGTIVKKFTITNSIAGAAVTGIPASYLYTGEAFVPEPVVKFNGITLTKNVDYTVVYRNNVNVGTASVIVSGMGKYSGTKIVTFVITQKTITGCTIFMVSSQNFTGKLITPPVVVKDGNRALTQGVDYQLSYSNNLDVGTGYITIVGRGDYEGTVTKEFKIVAQDPVENVLIQNRKEDAGTFDVLIDGAAVYVDNIRVEVWAKEDKSDIHSYDALRVDGDTFIAHVDAANHGHVSGTYQIAVYASGQNYAEHPAFQSATAFQPVIPTNGNDQQGNQDNSPNQDNNQNQSNDQNQGNDQAQSNDQNQGNEQNQQENQQDTTVVVIRPGVWHSSSSGWWYEYVDDAGGYVSSSWLELDGTWYYFDGSGYMLDGWQCINGTWYYFGSDGCMRTGWQMVDGTWYYMKDSGAMATGWQQIDGIWYYFHGDGSMATGWQQIGGTWYYLRDSGAMVTGWIRSGNTWYYMKDSGAMATGWQLIGGTWYYMYGSGAMATNTWIGRDYVSASGAWTTSR